MKKNKPKKHSTKNAWRPGDWGALAVCRFQAGGDLPAAVLLYHAKWRLRGTNGDFGKTIGFKKTKDPNSGKTINEPITERSGPAHKVLTRKNKQWIAASRGTWAKEAGLTLREYDRAIRELRRYSLVEAKNWKLDGKVRVWIRVLWEDLPKLQPDEVELYEMKRDSGFRILGGKKQPVYPKRHRLNRKSLDAKTEEFMRGLAKKSVADKAAAAAAQTGGVNGGDFSPTENSEDFAKVQNLEI